MSSIKDYTPHGDCSGLSNTYYVPSTPITFIDLYFSDTLNGMRFNHADGTSSQLYGSETENLTSVNITGIIVGVYGYSNYSNLLQLGFYYRIVSNPPTTSTNTLVGWISSVIALIIIICIIIFIRRKCQKRVAIRRGGGQAPMPIPIQQPHVSNSNIILQPIPIVNVILPDRLEAPSLHDSHDPISVNDNSTSSFNPITAPYAYIPQRVIVPIGRPLVYANRLSNQAPQLAFLQPQPPLISNPEIRNRLY
jgi:hypothetical protein